MKTFRDIGNALSSTSGVPMNVLAPNDADKMFAVQAEDGSWGVTTDPTTSGAKACVFHMVGRDSRVYRRRRHELIDALRARSSRVVKTAQIEEEEMKVVAAGIIGWENIPWTNDDGTTCLLDFNDENLLKFLDAYRPAFDQANAFIADRNNFYQSA